jgi:hypothetical protein
MKRGSADQLVHPAPGPTGSLILAWVIAASALLALALPAAAGAMVLHFKGSADADSQTQVSFDVTGRKAKVKKGKKTKKVFVASTISDVHVEEQLFTCYDASGNAAYGGRFTSQYEFFDIKPMTVGKSGKFSGTYEAKVGSAVISRETFTGTIKGRTAKGTFQAQYDPGGIEYGYCGNASGEPYTASG